MEKIKDDLAKYSYPIFTNILGVQHAATAFFFSHKDSTYLVSNYHTIKGMSPMHNRLNWTTDILYLKVKFPNNENYTILTIDISDSATGKSEIFYMFDRIDLFKIKIETNNLPIHYINDLIDYSIINKNPRRLLIYGYPNPEGISTPFWSQVDKFESIYNTNGFDKFYKATMKELPRFNEKEKMYALDKFYFLFENLILGGYSGAPIFGEFQNEHNQYVYKFFGVNFGNEPLSNQSWGIKPDICLDYLKNDYL